MTRGAVMRIAHHGGGSLAPANSLRGIELSLTYGVEMIEVDVRRTRDGQLVLSHEAVPRGQQRAVADCTLHELQAAVPEFTTLDEAFDATRGRSMLNLDIKEGGVAQAVVDAVRTHGAVERCIVSCLDTGCLADVGRMEGRLPRFYSYPPDYGGASQRAWMKPAVTAAVAWMRLTMPRRLGRVLRALPGTSATIYAPLVTPQLVARARTLGAQLYTWTVDDLPEMQRLASLGVDGITSNRPDLLVALAGGVPARI